MHFNSDRPWFDTDQSDRGDGRKHGATVWRGWDRSGDGLENLEFDGDLFFSPWVETDGRPSALADAYEAALQADPACEAGPDSVFSELVALAGVHVDEIGAFPTRLEEALVWARSV